MYLIFPWFKLEFVDHQREILLIAHHTHSNSEIRFHFDKNGRIQSIDNLPRIFFKCFHQQTSSHRPDILYEYRSHSIIPSSHYSSLLQHQTLLDPTHPLTLPLDKHIIPVVSYSMITNIFRYDQIEVHLIRIFAPIHYKNDDFYKYRCIAGYLEQAQQFVEIHVASERFDREKLRFVMSVAVELSQMFD